MENYEQIKKLMATANQIKQEIDRYTEKVREPQCDKYEMKFNGDRRFSSAKVEIR